MKNQKLNGIDYNNRELKPFNVVKTALISIIFIMSMSLAIKTCNEDQPQLGVSTIERRK